MPVRWDTITVDDQPMRVYVGVPDGAERCAGILVAQHGAGVDGFIQDVVNRLFRQGYIVAAPELYHRQPPDVKDNLHEFHTYNHAGHAFQNFLEATRYRSRPARGSWTEMLAFFAEHLKA